MDTTKLEAMTKDELVDALKAAGVPMGDYARKSKAALLVLASVHGEKINAAPEVVAGAHSVAAKFPGRCKACMLMYSVRERIARNGAGQWVHAECVNHAAAPEIGAPHVGDAPQDKAQGNAQGEAQGNAQGEEQGNAQGEAQGNAQGEEQGEGRGKGQGNTDADAFVVAVRSAVAGDGAPGKTMLDAIEQQIPSRESIQAVANETAATLRKEIAAVSALAKEYAEKAAKQAGPARIMVKVGNAPEVNLEGRQHALFGKVLKLAAARQNVLLVGPAGCGKTHLAANVAKALSLPFGSNSISAGMSESALTGYLLPVEAGRCSYVSVPFVNAYEKGGVHLLDEIDAGDSNVLLIINTALANGSMSIHQKIDAPIIHRHADFVCIAAANTFGHGADMMYVGRNQLDSATLDRFYIVPMDYDADLELGLGSAEVVAFVHALREKVRGLKLRRTVSTRMIGRIEAALAAGFTMKQAKIDAVSGWSRDDLSKVGAL